MTTYKHKRFQRKFRESFGDVIFIPKSPQTPGTIPLSGSGLPSLWTGILLYHQEAGP